MARSSNSVRFGLHTRAIPGDMIVHVGQVGEANGFDFIAFSDQPPGNNIEAWTAATAVGVQTTSLQVTHSTLNVPWRNPALLAKMAASLDQLTQGRVILTLGAGGMEEQYISYGCTFGTPGQRITDLGDAIAIIRGLWEGEPFDYQGKRLSVAGARVLPRPFSGRIPIFIGAGQPRNLRQAGAVADGWVKNQGWIDDEASYASQIRTLEDSAEASGRDPRTIHRLLSGYGYIGEEDPATKVPWVHGIPGGLVGTPDRILDDIEHFRELGVDTFQLAFAPDGIDEQLQRFGEEVIAKLRSPAAATT